MSPSNGNRKSDYTEDSRRCQIMHPKRHNYQLDRQALLQMNVCLSPKLELIPCNNSVSGPQRDKEGENCSQGGYYRKSREREAKLQNKLGAWGSLVQVLKLDTANTPAILENGGWKAQS